MTPEDAKNLFDYNRQTGELSWKTDPPVELFSSPKVYKRHKTQFGGKTITNCDSTGYLQVRWMNKLYLVHRVVWAIETGNWPTTDIDHRNHDRGDNRITNLRDIPFALNVAIKKNNKSGHPCICYVEQNTNRPWMVQVYSKGRYLTQRSFSSIDEAIKHRDHVRSINNLPAL